LPFELFFTKPLITRLIKTINGATIFCCYKLKNANLSTLHRS